MNARYAIQQQPELQRRSDALARYLASVLPVVSTFQSAARMRVCMRHVASHNTGTSRALDWYNEKRWYNEKLMPRAKLVLLNFNLVVMLLRYLICD